MKQYYQSLYPIIQNKKSYIIPYVLDKKTVTKVIDNKFVNEIKQKYSIYNETIIAFAGSFKILGGVPELIKVFVELEKIYPEIKLILIGDGETYSECKSIISSEGLKEKVIFIGRAPYKKLQSFYSIADIIVCPDKQNPFSELIVHAKYYDALFSGKIVITGNFKSINEINKNQIFSLVYNPSSRESLKNTMLYSIKNKNILLEKYKKNKIYGIEKFTYDNYLDNFN